MCMLQHLPEGVFLKGIMIGLGAELGTTFEYFSESQNKYFKLYPVLLL